jgi:SAM-dependent methyltransferase
VGGLRFLLAVAALASAPAQAQSSHHEHQHRFADAEKWAREFDDPKRDEWQKPHEVILALALPERAVVADIGAGTGYFSARLAHMLPGGTIYALDTEPDMVRHLATRAARENLENLRAGAAQAGDPGLPEKADLALLVDVYHHVENRIPYFRRLRAWLKAGGRVAIVDFRMDAPIGPPPAGRVAPERVVQEMHEAGYVLAQRHDFLPYQYFLVFAPQAR